MLLRQPYETLDTLPTPEAGDRVVALGNTGEGKSYMFDALLRSQPNAIIINTKHDPSFGTVGERIERDEDIYRVGKGRFDFRPSDAWINSIALKDRFFRWALNAGGPRVIYIDEFDDVCDSAVTFPPALKKCVKQGRWKGVGIWGSTQEPVRAPSFLYGQAQHRYLFYLGWDVHRKVAEAFFQQKIPWELIPERSHRFMLKVPWGTYLQPPLG